MNQIGPYIVEAELGRGAMGIVYRARDPLIGREVAVKVVNLAAASGPHEQQMLRDRMIREAMAAGTLSHPGIVTVYHAGELPWGVFIAMELVDGQPLDRLLEQDKCPRDLVLPILSQLAAALDYAHARGVIHRDVKPSNVLLGRDGRVRLCDFGIAKLLTAPSATASAGLVLGTPNYMAPEQILGEPVTAQTDQYALAVLAYELLTGQRPFVADTLPLLFRKIADDPPPPAHQIDPGLPAAVSLVLAKALSKDPQLRYPDCSRFVSALQQACIENPRWLSSGSASRSARWDAIHLDPSTGKRPPAEGPIAAGASQATPDSAGHDLLGPRSGRVAVTGTEDEAAPVPELSPRQGAGRAADASPSISRRRSVMVSLLSLAILAIVVAAPALLRYGRTGPRMAEDGTGKTGSPMTAPGAEELDRLPSPRAGRSDLPAPAAASARSSLAVPRAGESASSPSAETSASKVNPQAPISPWPMFRGNPARTGQAPVAGPRRPVLLWSVELTGHAKTSPLVDSNGIVYVATSDGLLSAVMDGRILWSRSVGSIGEDGLAVPPGGGVCAYLAAGPAACFDAGGNRLSALPRLTFPGALASAILPEARFRLQSTFLLADSTEPWMYDLGRPAATLPVFAPGQGVIVGTASGQLLCLARPGRVLWSYQAPMSITGMPAVTPEGNVVFGCGDRNLYCIRQGELVWRFPTQGPVYSSPLVDSDGATFFGSNDGFLYAVERNGALRWKLHLGNEVRSAPAIDAAGRIYAATVARRLYAVGDPD
jgi:serine/threonine protein kinase/outer membrane protein assembly factor BamB